MTTDRFDEASRYVPREDARGVFAWLYEGFVSKMHFCRWLDTRTAAGSDEPRATADTVAELERLDKPEALWLVNLEFQTTPDPDMFGRLMVQLGRAWLDHRPDSHRGSRYQLMAAVINLTGSRQSAPASREYIFPLASHHLVLNIKEVYLAEESASETLARIECGEVSPSVLAFVPLMTGAAEDDNLARWK